MKALLNQLQFELNDIKMPAEQKAVITTLIDQIECRSKELEDTITALRQAAGTADTLMRMQDNMIEQCLTELQKRGVKVSTEEDIKRKVEESIAADLKTTKQWT